MTESKSVASKIARVGAGRPTRAQAEQRSIQLLQAALDAFAEGGYDGTSIDAICASIGMNKRTVYARYKDKAELFHAAIRFSIEQWNIPVTLLSPAAQTLEQELTEIARLRARASLSPTGIKLLRLLNAESMRFPDLMSEAYSLGSRPVIESLVRLLRYYQDAGDIVLPDEPELVARAFMWLSVGGVTRSAVMGQANNVDLVERHITFAVTLFVQGLRA